MRGDIIVDNDEIYWELVSCIWKYSTKYKSGIFTITLKN